jgi:hypothetical protein
MGLTCLSPGHVVVSGIEILLSSLQEFLLKKQRTPGTDSRWVFLLKLLLFLSQDLLGSLFTRMSGKGKREGGEKLDEERWYKERKEKDNGNGKTPLKQEGKGGGRGEYAIFKNVRSS